jgi:hypothetical protein
MDPLESAARWRRWTVSGPGSAITRLIDELDAHLPVGWVRLSGDALLPYRAVVRPESAWYAIDKTAYPVGVALSLDRLGESNLRGGQVWFDWPPPFPTLMPHSVSIGWNQVMQFLDEGIIPAARVAGGDFRLPTPEEVFLAELPADVRERLRGFSQAAPKSLPLGREDAERWRGFVVAAFRGAAVLDPEQFTAWFVAEGWPKGTAAELTARFFDECLLLSRYADEASAA